MSRLWTHQQEAVLVFREYLGRKSNDKAAIVSMPTGTGKSAVIASLLADERSNARKSVLVIAPWKGLAAQLREDIDTKVWVHLGVGRPASLAPVELVKSAADFMNKVRVDNPEPTVYVTTMAMVVQIFKAQGGSPSKMAEIFIAFSCVIVDECHYEPAPTWSVAVRATGLPTCLMTATPFRNDNKRFVLDSNCQFRYSHAKAVEDAILREPKFHILESVTNEVDFARVLCAKIEILRVPASTRVVVRCTSKASVEAMVHALRAQGHIVYGFHETFDAKVADEGLLKRVPPPSERPEDIRFWVHQHKLTEGFDQPKLNILAIYEGFGNDRARIQQIGRVLRMGSGQGNASAHVLALDGEMEDAWDRYRRYDDGEAPHKVATDPAGIEALLAAQPKSIYWDRLFREQVDLSADDAWKHLRFRLNASVRHLARTPNLDQIMDEVTADHIEKDQQVLSVTAPDRATRVLIYLSVENSPLLLAGAFVEMSLGYALVHWDGSRLFVADSGSSVPRSVQDSTNPIPAQSLVSLLPDSARISTVTLVNNDLGPWSVRGRSISADDLRLIAPEVGVGTFGYSTAKGSIKVGPDNVTRYAGVKNARVRDQRPTEGKLADVLAWFSEIGQDLDANNSPSRVIGRYSSPAAPPGVSQPTYVMIDVDPDSFEPIDSNGPPLTVEKWGGTVGSDRSFVATIAGVTMKTRVTWSEIEKRFDLESDFEVPYRSKHGRKASFWDEVQRSRGLKVADKSGVVYSNGNFWSLEPTERDAGHGLLSIVSGHSRLEASTGEKGTVINGKWDPASVFGIIDQALLPNALGAGSTILCTDMGTEIADFVGFSDSKVIFVHAKGKTQFKKSHVSASALHEVVSQAVKNMKYLAIGNVESPSTTSWTNPWTDGIHGATTRHRAGTASNSGEEYWNRINRVVQNHGAEREIWLVLGASLSLKRLAKALAKKSPPGYAVTTHALLSSAWSTSQQYGVRLRVLCSP